MAQAMVCTRCWLAITALFLGSCGGGAVAGSSPVPAAPTSSPAAPVSPAVAWPAAVDPELIQAIAYGGTPGHPLERWAPGAVMHHCAGPGMDLAVMADAADLITRVSGIPRTTAGPCNVQWDMDPTAPGGAATWKTVNEAHVITAARVGFKGVFAFDLARHEAGHVLGLAHSPRREDLMYATPAVPDFTAEELAILSAMYPR